MEIIELLTPAYEVAWLPWAVQYFFLIGIGATAALTASGCALARSTSPAHRLLPALVTVLLACVVAAPVSLLADLHQPGRFWHFYAYFTPWSWMSLGAYLLPLFVVLALSFSFAWWSGRATLLRVIAVLLACSAIAILVYSGSEVMVLRSRPLWNTVFLPINFALTAWLAALGAVLLVARWLPGGTQALPSGLVRRLALIATAGLAAAALLWALAGVIGMEPSFDQALRLFDEFPVWRWSFWGSVIAGIAILLLISRPAHRLTGTWYSLLIAGATLAVAWIFRWTVFMGVQSVPKYGAGLYLYNMPLGSDGLLGMVGVLGLCIALLATITYLLERFPAAGTPAAGTPAAGTPAAGSPITSSAIAGC